MGLWLRGSGIKGTVMDTDIDTIMEADMEKNEIIEMIADMDRIGDFVRRQMAIMPTESREKAEAAAKVQAVKHALVRLLDEHEQKIKGLTDRIQARAWKGSSCHAGGEA